MHSGLYINNNKEDKEMEQGIYFKNILKDPTINKFKRKLNIEAD